MKRTVALTAALLALTLAGCTSTRQVMDSWVGSTGAEFIAGASMGPPEEVRSDGRGGQILIWGSYPNAVTQVYVDTNDRIYFWRTYGGGTWVDWNE